MSTRSYGVLMATAATVVLAACSNVPYLPDHQGPNVPFLSDHQGRVYYATSRTDHLQLVAYFESRARSYDAEAQQHDKLADSYARGVGLGPRVALELAAPMATHCRKIAERFRASAADARALAQGHRELAGGGK